MKLALVPLLTCVALSATAQMVVVKPVESDRVLNNPGIGFTTFQRFNGDSLNGGTGWTEGMPIDYSKTPATPVTHGYPNTTVAYLRLYWRFFERAKGRYDFALLDRGVGNREGARPDPDAAHRTPRHRIR